MPSHPTLFDDDGEPRAGSDGAGSPAREANTEPSAPRAAPNYLIRRALVVGGVVAVIAAAAVVIGSLIGTGGDDTSSGAADPEWNRVVLVDERTGRITVIDGAGDEVARISSVSSPTASAVVDATVVVTSDETTAIVDLDEETVREVDLAASDIVAPSGSTRTLVAAATTGQRGLIVHGPTGDSIDTDEFAPVAGAAYEFGSARTDTSGRHVLVTDSGNFQSVLFSFDRDEPSFFPGLALAVSDDLVVTAQNVGNDATISVFDHAGAPRSSGRTASVRAGMITGDTVRLVTVEGVVVTLSIGSGETDAGPTVDIGTVQSGSVMVTGDRLVLTGSAGTAIVDDTGAVVGTYPNAQPLDDIGSLRGADCIVLAGDDTTASSIWIVNARTGDLVTDAEVVADAAERTADGCTVAIARAAGIDVLSDGTTATVDDSALLALAPDGAVVAAAQDGRIVLVPIGGDDSPDDTDDADDTGDLVDLGTTGRRVAFTQT